MRSWLSVVVNGNIKVQALHGYTLSLAHQLLLVVFSCKLGQVFCTLLWSSVASNSINEDLLIFHHFGSKFHLGFLIFSLGCNSSFLFKLLHRSFLVILIFCFLLSNDRFMLCSLVDLIAFCIVSKSNDSQIMSTTSMILDLNIDFPLQILNLVLLLLLELLLRHQYL